MSHIYIRGSTYINAHGATYVVLYMAPLVLLHGATYVVLVRDDAGIKDKLMGFMVYF